MSIMSQKTFVLLLAAILLIGLAGFPNRVRSQDPAPQKIESDDARITRTGEWLAQSSPNASGGGYLYNKGAGILTLEFSGPSIEILYISGPTLGTLAIEIDGTVLRTVITTAEKTAYGQSSRIDYLTDGPHELKAYAQEGGVVGIDAFITSPPLSINVEGEEESGIQATFCSPSSTIHRVSFTSTGAQTNHQSDRPAISADGRFVAFSSLASLVPGDGDATADIYVYDRQTCTTQLVSVSSAGVKSNGISDDVSISADGRFIAFESIASNLVAGDTNTRLDMFVHDRVLGTTIRASVATGGAQHTGLVAHNGVISGNGRFVAFTSDANNLVTGDTNAADDIFVFDRQTNTTTRVSVVSGGGQSNGSSFDRVGITHDGNFVGFASLATNLVAGDTNSQFDVFVHDRNLSITTRISVATGGVQITGGQSFLPTLSNDGRFVSFLSESPNVVAGDTNGDTDAFVHDRQTNTTIRVSVGPGGSQMTGGSIFLPQISGDGRYIMFTSQSPNLVAGDTNNTSDVFLHDRQTSITSRVSLTSTGGQAVSPPTDGAGAGSISPDGRWIAFESLAANMVTGDTNGFQDIFVTPRVQPVTDKLALMNPTFESVVLLDTLNDNPPAENYTFFSAYTPITGGQWVMGDWNGDGLKTPGVYNNGPFFYTNKMGESQPSDWRSLWIGVAGVPVSGRFNGALPNDCIGAVQTASLGGSTVFVLYFTCDLSGNTLPTISNQWLSAVLPDSGGFSGTHQFKAGDFNSDGVDSIAVRRGTFIAFGNVAPVTGPAAFDLAQFIGTPAITDAGSFVVGDWDASGADSFGLFYQSGEFFYRNDLTFNSGVYVNQSIGSLFAGPIQATTWR